MPKERKQKKRKIFTKSFKPLKQKLKLKLGIGVSRIKFRSKVTEIPSKTSEILKDTKKNLRVIPRKKRLYKIIYNSKKRTSTEKGKPTNSLNYLLKKKLTNTKKLHMRKIRTLRKELRDTRDLVPKKRRSLYLKIKAAHFKDLKDLKRAISHQQ
jgi:ribosomal protein L19E